MLSNRRYRYFSLSFKYIINKLYIIIIIKFIEYIILLSEILAKITFFIEKYDKNFNDQFFLNKINLIFYYRKLLKNNNKYPFYLILIPLFFHSLYYVYYFNHYIKKNEIVNKIIINFYQLFYFRILYFFYIDIIHNLIVFYWANKVIKLKTSIIIVFLCFFWVFLVITIVHNYHNNITYINIHNLNNQKIYPFDFLSNFHHNFYFILVTLLSLSHNLISISDHINFTRLLIFAIILITFAQILIEFNIIYYNTYLYFNNFILHRVRITINLFICFCEIGLFLNSYKNQNICFFYMAFYFIFCLIIYINILTFSNFFEKKIKNIHFMTSLFYIKTLKNDYEKNLYIEIISNHIFHCKKCMFCRNYNKRIENQKKIEKKNIIQANKYILYNIYKSLLTCLNFEIKLQDSKSNKVERNIVKYLFDLLTIYKYEIISDNINFNVRLKMTEMINKYKESNINVVTNIILIYKELYEEKEETDYNLIELLKFYELYKNKLDELLNNILQFYLNYKLYPSEYLKIGFQIKEIKEALNYLKSNQHLNNYNLNLINLIIEELINFPINKDKGLIIDYLLYDDGISYNFQFNKNIIININPAKKTNLIIKTGKDLNFSLGKEISSLFPKELKNEGKKLFLKSLKSNNKIKFFDFIVFYTNENNDKKYCRFNMKFKLINLKLFISEEIYLHGQYKFNLEEIFISKQFSSNLKGELVFYKFDIEYIHYINTDKLNLTNKKINILKNNDFNQNLYNVCEFFSLNKDKTEITIDNKKYSLLYKISTYNFIYSIYHLEKEENISINENSSFNYKNIENMLLDNTSMNNSSIDETKKTNKSIFNDNSKKNSDLYLLFYMKRFRIVKIIFLLSMIVIIFIFAIFLIYILNKYKNISNINFVYSEFRGTNRLFYNIIISVFTVNCIANKNENSCINYFLKYNKNQIDSFNLKFLFFNFTIFENLLKLGSFSEEIRNIKLLIYNLNNKELTKYFESEFNYTYISQLKPNFQKTTFINALERFSNSLTIISNYFKSYQEEPLFIFTKDELDFSNLFNSNIVLKEWQVEYYNLIINYEKFLSNFQFLENYFKEYLENKINNINFIFISLLIIFFVIHCILILFSVYYIYLFKIIFKLILNKLIIIIDEENYHDFFIKKIKNLILLNKYYDKNPLLIIKEINNLKHDYIKKRKNIESKIPNDEKEENIKLKENQNNYFNQKDFYKIIKKKYILLFHVSFYFLLLFLIFFVIWNIYFNKIIKVFDYVNLKSVFINQQMNFYVLIQIMVLGNTTELSISKNFDCSFECLSINIDYYKTILVKCSQYLNNIKIFMNSPEKIFSFNCSNFYNEINDTRFTNINKENPNFKFNETYSEFCNLYNLFYKKDEKVLMNKIIYEEKKLINIINNGNKSYEFYISLLNDGNLFFISNLINLIFRPYTTWLNKNIFNVSINKSLNFVKYVIYLNMILTIVSDLFIFILLDILIFNKLQNLINIINNTKFLFDIVI